MLKKRLYIRRFYARFVNFYTTTAFETFCELYYKYLDLDFIEPAFCERDKNHKFFNFKTVHC